MPSPRDHFTAVVLGNQIMIIGGRKKKANKAVTPHEVSEWHGDMIAFNIAANCWPTVSSEIWY